MPFQHFWHGPITPAQARAWGFDDGGPHGPADVDDLSTGTPPVLAGRMLALRRSALRPLRFGVRLQLVVRATQAAAEAAQALQAAGPTTRLAGDPLTLLRALKLYADLGVRCFVFEGPAEEARQVAERLLPLLPGRRVDALRLIDSPFDTPSYVARTDVPALW